MTDKNPRDLEWRDLIIQSGEPIVLQWFVNFNGEIKGVVELPPIEPSPYELTTVIDASQDSE